ncbi:hypothetical protein CO051_03500 [Candidatus Roizmanbacteria bacterium CG_4_9_14_0_2_um_filter_39_13]|uniref:Uncharacterized protein n=1 Tax=Candidatus Roizmanbacteria bacterium CG_4_9_14_0_2_um_filter_39_13 TaxID=1974839 RepID=A0A2M8EZ40_9BACT|nr:MAG: hypothetical protein COY15_05125 [Candidatus Roizmanbacteria bacterium CG_4_10_14_0_2_um_filter_39_12]PJC32170.1 MAG: hypothetical protein CO051_03500 [Candidatus Roizmanbacteria bacterium CG_4_9_14_0_2_um_filter_39_13]
MSEDTYNFPSLSGGEETGFHDPLIYNFNGEILYHLTRESIQNIVDAKDPIASGPVIAEFKLSAITASSLPNADKLKEVFGACWRHEKNDNGEGVNFFKKAYDLINDNKSIYILNISDYNSTGLFGGEEDREGAYYKLMKISGSSNKGAGKGGTYGLGKGAYFRPSLFRMIFVSSIWGNNESVFQGKLRLVSHELEGDIKQGIGFYHNPSVRVASEIPEMFRRKEKGTSIFIIGFEDLKNWQKKMMVSVLRYFWLAILEGNLEVKIENTIVNAENVESKLKEYFSEAKVFEKDNPLPYYKAYRDGEVINSRLNTLGNVELRVFFQKDFPRRVEYFRNTGMVIQNKQHQSGKGFAGVFICGDSKGILRKMEDPTHSKWSKDVPVTTDIQEKNLYAEAENELKEFVANSLSNLTATVETTTSVIKDLDKYFYSPADENDLDKLGNPESIEGQIVNEETGSLIRGENIIEKTPKINIQVTNPTHTFGELEGNEGKGGRHGGGKGNGEEQPAQPEEKGTNIVKINKNIKFRRSFITKNEVFPEHNIIISGEKGEQFNMEVRVGTEDSFDVVYIKEARDQKGNKLIVNENQIKNIIIPDEGVLKMIVIFNEPGKYSLNLKGYEN